ncbi:hypothetical protein [Nocardia sp. CA-135398]
MGATFEFNEDWLREIQKTVTVSADLSEEEIAAAVTEDWRRRGLVQ